MDATLIVTLIGTRPSARTISTRIAIIDDEAYALATRGTSCPQARSTGLAAPAPPPLAWNLGFPQSPMRAKARAVEALSRGWR